MTRLRCAILDDYLNLSLTIANWSKKRPLGPPGHS
jgi:hypothetical protein